MYYYRWRMGLIFLKMKKIIFILVVFISFFPIQSCQKDQQISYEKVIEEASDVFCQRMKQCVLEPIPDLLKFCKEIITIPSGHKHVFSKIKVTKKELKKCLDVINKIECSDILNAKELPKDCEFYKGP